MAQDFKNLKVWSKSLEFSIDVYNITKAFPKEEKFGIINQLRRASMSIQTNIAEGCGRSKKEFINFLRISLGSSKECENLIILSKRVGYISEKEFDSLTDNISHISAMITNLLKKIK